MFVCDDSFAKTRIELFTTSTASDIKTKKDCYRLRALLEAKKITFTEIDLAVQLWKRQQMLGRSNGFSVVPQLHAYGKFIGDLSRCQELEDFGELDEAIQTALEEGCLALVRQERETPETADSRASTHSSPDSQLRGKDTPSREPEYPNSPPSEGSASRQSCLTLSPVDSPLRGIYSTGSLEAGSAASEAESSHRDEAVASLAGEMECKQSGSDVGEDEMTCASLRRQESDSESKQTRANAEGGATHATQSQGSSPQRDSEARELPCSSNGVGLPDSGTDSEAGSSSSEVQAYPVDPSTDTQPCTPVSQGPSVVTSGQQVSSPFSQASSPTIGYAPAAVEDPWDAASSDGAHSPGLTALHKARSVDGGAPSSGAASGEPQAVAQKPRRRSLTSGIIRGADRADEDAAEQAAAEKSMKTVSLSEGKHAPVRENKLKTQTSFHNGDSGHLTFSYVKSTPLSPSEDETKDILAELHSQRSASDSEGGDWVRDMVSSLKPENASTKKAANR